MRKLAIIISTGAMLCPSISMAGGEIYERKLSSTSLGTCDNDLIEGVSQAGGGYYYHSEVFVACMKSTNRASWIFLANEGCSWSKKCSEKPPDNAPPPFISPEDYWKPKPGPISVRFEVFKYVKGFDCRLWSPAIKYVGPKRQGYYGDYTAWVCDRFDVYDGTPEMGEFSRSASKPFVLTNVGPTEPKPNPEKISSRNVALPEGVYRLDWLTEVFVSP